MRGLIALTIGAALVAGCAGGNKPSPRQLKQIDRALERAPGKAQPSTIVKTELALNRMARESGQLTAFKQFAAPNAQIHDENGLRVASAVMAGESNPDEPSQLSTKTVLMSCDGSIAVSQGRGLDPDGTVGTYIIVWERQPNIRPDGDEETGYRYIYFTGAADVPQPPPPAPRPDPLPGEIVVEALDAVKADIARCAPREEIYLNALAQPASGNSSGTGNSRDKTLQWNWFHESKDRRGFTVSLWRKDGRETAFTQSLPSAP